MNFLISLLEAPPGPVSTRSLAELHPTLIRVPIDSIASAEVVQYAQTWPLLRVQYRLGEHDEAGIVHFCPTEFFKRGEFQLLGFEGNEPYYTLYLPVAQASMTTWHLGDE
jgi:hypothetical protein